MKDKLEGDAPFFDFTYKIIRLVCGCVVMVIFIGFMYGEGQTPPPPPHVCEVTSADLRSIIRIVDGKMKEFDKKLAYRDMQIAGLQRQLYDKQNGVKKK